MSSVDLSALGRTLLGRREAWRVRWPVAPNPPLPSLAWVGPIILLVSTGMGWLAFVDAVGKEGDPAFALFIGSVSILFMAWSNVLATRWRGLEPFFGGLDRMYRWHRWFGALSVGAMWLHTQQVDDVKGIPGAAESVADAAEDLAGTGETLLYLLVIVSLVRWVPYRWWRQSHKLMILPFVFSSWHFHTATKPYSNDSAWGRWFQTLMVLGIFAWVYRVIWRDGLARGRRFTVSSVTRAGPMTTVEMAPVRRLLPHAPGQFVFVRIGRGALAEPHPFTIASAPHEPRLRLHIKNLGDWSERLASSLTIGERVRVEGPYGGLELHPGDERTTVWIAGGVGITPFLGASAELPPGCTPPHLFYAVRSREEAVGLDLLEAAATAGRIQLHLHISTEDCRLCAADLEGSFGSDGLRHAHVVMCGPDSLIRDMTRTVRRLGARRVHVEAFDIRTGVGPDLSREIDGGVRSLRQWVSARKVADA